MVCPWCEAEKKSSIAFTRAAEHAAVGRAAEEWEAMNTTNKRMMAAYQRSNQRRVNIGRKIGVEMVEWVD